jgi:RimJ/RimL family protein N-acetyltransferase
MRARPRALTTMAPTQNQARVIVNLKAYSVNEPSLPIADDRGGTIGRLIPVNSRLAKSERVIRALYNWRKAHMTSFLTVFTPDLDSTRDYLTRFSIPDPGRILFLIADSAGRLVGNIGLCNICRHRAELDNVIRGEKIEQADFMVFAQWALLRWAFSSLDVRHVYLNVLAHNKRAIRSYEKAGFRDISRTPLVRRSIEGGYRLVPAPDPEGEATDMLLITMELDRISFYQRHPHLRRKQA